ncbi:GGDEF domain-containing protein [Azospirillum sp. YIM DDC1]|uniref:diguanylate cyclase n=1 Tax=Azospirillum aestuarii TaxID=2802052 RepID=A0ABS1HSL2_9PROT|nr:GGDEF domain-containing protein [Azospirillum aestuarii]MBK4717804.1 GGDEF domain-containing protein [Azospirillum aestuarii]
MILDTRTLVIVLVGIGVLLSIAAFLAWKAHRHITALAYWAGGALAGAAGMALVMLYGVWPPALVIPLSNALVAATYLLNWFGVRSFAGRPIPWRSGLALLAALTAGNAWFVVMSNDVTARILVGSAGITGLSLLAALELWRMGPADQPRRAQRVTALVFLIHALFVAGRAVLTAWGGPVDSVLMPNLVQSAGFLEAILAVTGWGFGFLAMTSERLQADLDRIGTIDPLTGAYNRRAFMKHAERELARSQRSGAPLTLLLLDLDRFKRVNDTFGHLAGDALLRLFSETVTARLRRTDLFGRYGGEEFCVLLPDTDRTGAAALAEALRRDVSARPLAFQGQEIAASVSIGIAACRSGEDLDTALAAADLALYRAKRNGRNQVVIAEAAG